MVVVVVGADVAVVVVSASDVVFAYAVAVDVINLIHKRYLSLCIVTWFEDSLAVPGNLRQGILSRLSQNMRKKRKLRKLVLL